MKAKRDIKTMAYISAHPSEILSQISKTHNPVYIKQKGETKAVLLDTESYEKMCNSLSLLKILSFGEKDIRKGNITPQDEFFEELFSTISKK